MEENNLTKLQLRKIKAKERMRRLRKNRIEEQRKLIQQKDTESHRKARLDEERRQLERERDLTAHRFLREDKERRLLERERDSEAHRLAREDEERRMLERERDSEAHRLAREDEERRMLERERDSVAHRFAREDEERRMFERGRDSEAHRLAREDEERRQHERVINSDAHRLARQDAERRQLEQQSNTKAHRLARLVEERRIKERERDSDAHLLARSNLKRRYEEQEDNTIARKLARINIKDAITFEDLCIHYEKMIKIGPTIICSSCCGLFFPTSINTVKIQTLVSNRIDIEFLNQICDTTNDKLMFCINCYRDIKQLKLPNLSRSNGLLFPTIPPELTNLNEVEVRIVSPRIPFMQIRELSKRDRQFAIKGNVVNVPVSVDTSCSILPRTFDNTHTIQLKLKRKMCYQSYYMYETVRPAVCYSAIKYLIDTPLYKHENIKISENWLIEHSNDFEDFIVLEEDKLISSYENKEQSIELKENIDDWEEDKEEDNVTTNDTLWTDNDLTQTISFAPGEGKYPLSIIRDQYSEELSFPNIYCGQARQTKKNISYANICKWELRHYDRRCCYVPKIFFMLKKRQIQMITKQATMYLRKRKNTDTITAGQLLDKDFVENLCKIDDGYKFLKVDRASPPYWQARKREVLAMIRQIGLPTIFLTLSAAETRWKELLVILMKTVRNKEISEEDTINLDYKDKCELISKDPVTCSRYFDKRIRELFHVLQHPKGPFKEHQITDTYVRVEFQHRGSPHVHCLLWLHNAPVYLKDDNESIKNCVKFIDKFISASSSLDKNLIDLQTHGHSKSCKKFIGDNVTCRFDFPQLPMPTTIILEPIEASDELMEHYTEIYQTIKHKLSQLEKQHKNGIIKVEDITFNRFLEMVNLTIDDYIFAIRTQIKQPKVFLKRDLCDIRVNCYNKDILKLHRANLDIQFILDPYSCVQYILNYLNKPDRGMSKLLREAVEEVKSGNLSIRDRLKIIGDRYLKATEISAQEAVYHLLSMELSRCSRAHVFINTGEPNARNRIVKNEKALKEMDKTSKDIYQLGDLEYYTLRPDCIMNVCLADFCALYNRYNKRPNKQSKHILNENENDDQIMDDEEIGEIIALKNNAGYLEKRKKPKIIRFKRYNLKTDECNYYREQCQLYLPWFNEQDELININIKEKYRNNLEIINKNASNYVYYRKDVAEFEDKFKEEEFNFIENEEKDEQQSHNFSVYTIDNSADYSISLDISESASNVKMEKYLTPKYKSENEYRQLMQSLNNKQRKYCMQLLHRMKTQTKPVYNVIIGGAGVGKSCLINAIYQTLIRYFNGLPGAKPDTLKILLCAPTGKAAFNIGGVTTNSAFDIFNQNRECNSLSHDRRNTLLSNFIDLKLIIIDEISMVGISQFEQINIRLQDIFCNSKPFGGISVLCFGDFYQLRPVQDYFVFKINSNNKYGILFENHLWHQFTAFELTEIMRQKEDKRFATALNNLATASCTPEDIALFKSREILSNNITPPLNSINLFRTNMDVDEFNLTALNKNVNIAYESKAEDVAEGDVSVETKQRALEIIAIKKRTETYGLPTNLILKEGSNFMVTVNIDIEDGIVNGASGILRKIEAYDNKPYKIWVEFSDVNVGVKTRQRYQYAIRRSGYEQTWTPIEKLSRDIPMNNPKFRQNVRIRRTQFPLVSCEAMTINKAQGQSYDNVVVNISPKDKRTMLSHVYVAMSRARKANGLYINGQFYQPKKTNAVLEVETEVNRLRTEAVLALSLKFLADDQTDNIKIMYHNVQSLINNYQDLLNDNNYMSADLLLFAETWLMDGEEFSFPSFELINQITSKKVRKAYGCAVYSKFDCKQLFVYKHQDTKTYFNCIGITIKNTDIITVYNSAATSKSDLFDHLKKCMKKIISERVIVVGDFNINVLCDTNQDFVKFMNLKGFALRNSDVTTNGNTQIDLVFSRNCSTNVNNYESYFSYHKPLWFDI